MLNKVHTFVCGNCGERVEQEVECLECNNVYTEMKETVKECPYCLNTDMLQTIYLTHNGCGEIYEDVEEEQRKEQRSKHERA